MRVWITQTEPGASRAAALLGAAGFDTVVLPLLRIEPIEGAPLDAAGYDWLVLTSRNGVEAAFGRLRGRPPRLAVIGPGTAEAVRERGIEPDLVAAESTQEGLVAAFPRPPGRVLFAGAENARGVLARELGADVVTVYRTVPVRPHRLPDAHLVVLASASAARALAALGLRPACVSIGPATTAAAREHGLEIVAEAESHDLDGLVAAVRVAASRTAS